MRFDTVIKNGTVVTANDTFVSDLGVTDGQIAAIAVPDVHDALAALTGYVVSRKL